MLSEIIIGLTVLFTIFIFILFPAINYIITKKMGMSKKYIKISTICVFLGMFLLGGIWCVVISAFIALCIKLTGDKNGRSGKKNTKNG